MVTKVYSHKSLVNNDFIAENFLNSKIFRTFLPCKFSTFSCKRIKQDSCLRIQGLATTYNNSDFTKDVVSKEAFVSQADSDGFLCEMPFMYYEHDSNNVPGVWKSVRLNNLGVEVQGEVYSDYVIDLIQNDSLNALSIGFYILESERRYNFIKNQNYRYIKLAKLVEISLVSNPANNKAFFAPVDSLYFGDMRQG